MEKPLNSSPFYEIYDDSVVTKHWDSGFFSQSTLILCGILEFINNFKKNGTNALDTLSADNFVYILKFFNSI